MAIRLSITLLCALAVFAVGSGIGRVQAAEERAAISLEASLRGQAPPSRTTKRASRSCATVVVTATHGRSPRRARPAPA